jgi:hypothetical protein
VPIAPADFYVAIIDKLPRRSFRSTIISNRVR